jgi:hypothetical protein
VSQATGGVDRDCCLTQCIMQLALCAMTGPSVRSGIHVFHEQLPVEYEAGQNESEKPRHQAPQ